MEVKKASSLFMLFLRYLITFCLLLLLMMSVVGLSFYYALKNGILMPANHAERVLQSTESELAVSEPFDPSLIPLSCAYALFDKNNVLQSSDMSEKEITRIKNVLTAQKELPKGQYWRILRTDGSLLVIGYDIYAHFTDSRLHKLFPKPELTALLLLFVGFFLLALLTALRFSRRLKAELVPLMKATDAILHRDLDFEIYPTRIWELNMVLQSIDELKSALATSLKKQWNMDFQLSAITHDLKTPLTVIKGNTELLLEASPCPDDAELLQYIQTSADKIENYTQLLISTAVLAGDSAVSTQLFSVPELAMELKEQGQGNRIKKYRIMVID